MRSVLKWISRISVALLLLTVLLAGILSTTAGQRMLLSVAEFAAASDGKRIAFEKFEGSLFSSAKLGRIAVSDRDGTWLELRNAAFSWNPLALFAGRLEVPLLTIDAIEVSRLPRNAKRAKQTDAASSLPMLGIAADRLEISKILLGEEILGTAATFKFEGSAHMVDASRGLSAKLKLIRTDGDGGDVSANLSYLPSGEQLEVLVAASEPRGGILARHLGLPGSPPLAFNLEGRGALKNWRAQWGLAASGSNFIAGNAAIDASGATADTYRFETRFEGYLATILPSAIQNVFDGKTVGSLSGVWHQTGSFDAKSLTLNNDALQLQARAGFQSAPTFAYAAGSIRLARADGQRLEFIAADGHRISLSELQGSFDIPDLKADRSLGAQFEITDLQTPWGNSGNVRLASRGQQAQPVGKAALRLDEATLSLEALKIVPGNDKVASALGPAINLAMKGSGEPGNFKIETISASTNAATVDGDGEWKNGAGRLKLKAFVNDLKSFSGFAGVPIVGSATTDLTATFNERSGTIDFALQGEGTEVGLGDGKTPQILPGKTQLEANGRWSGAANWKVSNFQVSNPKLSLRAGANLQSGSLTAQLEGQLATLSLLSSSLEGDLSLNAKLEGKADELRSSMLVSARDVIINKSTPSTLDLTFNGKGSSTNHQGDLRLTGTIDGSNVDGSSLIAAADNGSFEIDQLKLAYRSARLTGQVVKHTDAPLSGRVNVSAPDLAEFAKLIGKPLAGAVSASAELSGTPERPHLKLSALSKRSQFAELHVSGLQAQADIANYLTSMEGQADIRVARIETDGFLASDLIASLQNDNPGMKLKFGGTLNGATAAARGRIVQDKSDYEIDLEDLQLKKSGTSVVLEKPSKIVVSNGTVQIQKLGISTSGGRASVTGSLGDENVDLKIMLSKLPAAIANLVNDDLGLSGTVDGSITAKGAIKQPTADIALDWRNASASAARDAGLPPVAISLKANLGGDEFKNQITVIGPDRLNLLVNGHGKVSNWKVLQQRLSGEVPLTLANPLVATRGMRLRGKAIVDNTISGSADAPRIDGTLALSSGTVHDPASGLKLTNLTGQARFDGDAVLIENLRGESDKGGVIDVSGRIAEMTTVNPRTQISVRLSGLKFNDKQLMAGEVDGNLALDGPLNSLTASGSVYIRRLDITVPNQLPRSVVALDLQHVNAPPHLRQAVSHPGSPTNATSDTRAVALNILVEAADRIFVRGRGLDAQLGGALRILGRSNRPAASGGFELVRGRLAILGRQLDFNRGKITFNGNFDPYIDLEASGQADDITATVSVYGPLSQLAFRFSSIPDLPEDEVVAKLLFNKSLASLSPLQIAQLASEIDKIGGLSSGPGILDQLKSSVGVDVLDFGTDDSGGATVSAGSYLNDQTYVGVKQGTAASSSRVIIDHDLTKTLKAKGEVGADGNSKIGIGVEWDY